VGGDRIFLDSGAVSALAAEKGRLRVALRQALAAGATISVPAPVVTETTTGNGSRDANVNRVLKTCAVLPLDEGLARAAGALRYRRRGAGAVDAMIVAFADVVPDSTIITGDPSDLVPLAAVRGRTAVVDLNRAR
jgi:predicted nucleic acid-binding protein